MRRSTIIFSVCLLALASSTAFGQPHFRYEETGGNHSILVEESRINGAFVEAGDEVGVFTPAGLCAGATVYAAGEGRDGAGFAAWGNDNAGGQAPNGFRNAEAFAFRFWDRGTQHEVAAQPEYTMGPHGYERDGLTILNLSANLEGPPDILVSAGEHDFSNVLVNERVVWQFTITNRGIDPLIVERISSNLDVFTTNFPDQEVQLGAAESRDVEVTFAPAEERQYQGTLTIEANDPDGDATVQLVGVGTVEHIADINVSPLEINFGEVELGHPATADLTITNVGNSDLMVSEVNVQGDSYSTNFDGETVIGAGQGLVLQVTFDPPAEESYDGTITVVSDDPDEDLIEVTLHGNGYIPPQPNIGADPSEIDFGDVIVGNIASRRVTISNSGDQPLGITGVTSDNEVFATDYQEEIPDGPRFRFTQTDGNHSILILEATLNGQSLEVDDEIGVFTPAGLCAGATLLTDDGDGIFPVGLAVWGDETGDQIINGFRNGEEMSFRFWDLSARSEMDARAEIIQGELVYSRDSFTIVNLSAGNRRQPEDIQETVIQPGESIEINVSFEPPDYAAYNGILTVSSNDPDSPEFEIPLSGRGAHEPPQIVVSADGLDFGSVIVGRFLERTLTISNEGVGPLEGTFELDGGQGSDYFTFEPAGFALDQGQSADFTVTFSPGELGRWDALLHVLSNDQETPDIGIDLTGVGRDLEPNIFVGSGGGYDVPNMDEVAHDFGQVLIGNRDSWSLEISNWGESVLTVERITSNEEAFDVQLDNSFTVEAGQTVAIDILFAPREERAYNGTITVISDDPDVGSFPLRVTGAGVMERLPDIALASNLLDFEALFVGGERTMQIEGSNVGLANLTISRVTVQGNGFSVDFDGNIVVAPNDVFVIPATFIPDELGDFAGTATIFSDDPDESQVVVNLIGRAIPEGEHYTFTITAENMSIIIEDAILDGNRLVSGDEVAVITPGGVCAGATLITDEWPLGVAAWGEDNNQEGVDGFRDGEEIMWKIWDQSSGNEFNAIADYSVGEGIYRTNGFAVATLSSRHVPTPRILLEPEQLGFGRVLRGESRSLMLNIANIGDGTLIVERIDTQGNPFSVEFNNQVSIEPDRSINVDVQFHPEEAGEYNQILTVFSNAPDNQEATINLSGVGINPSPPQISISADQHVFGEIGVGDRDVWDLIVSNTGGDVLSIEAPTLDGAGFEISPNNAFDVGVGEAAVLHVTFAPEEVRDYNASLGLNSNDPDNGAVSVSLTGTAVASPLHWRFQQTDGNMSLLVENATLDDEQLPIGSEVGVFTTDGLSAGSVRIEEYSFGIAAWGDDNNTPNVVDGFVDGEVISFRIWLPELGAEFAATAEYAEGEGIYHRDAFSVLSLSSTSPEGQGHFFYQITNANHSLLVVSALLNDELLAAGDEVAVFTSHGICAGSVILEEASDQPFGLAAWGDDLDTQPVEGFVINESMSFRYYDFSSETEYAGVESSIDEGPEEYSPNGFTVLRLDLYTLPQPEINIELAHNFGRIPVGSEASWDMLISNSGNADLIISSPSELDGEPFGLNFGEQDTLREGESAAFAVSFIPTSPGDFQDAITVLSNDRNEPRVVVSLSGTGFNPNHAPVWVNPPQVVEGSEVSHLEFTLTASDPDGDALSMQMTGDVELRDRAQFVDNEDGTGTFSWTPSYLDAGEYNPHFIVSDGDSTAEIVVRIVISDVNAPPEFVDFPNEFSVDEGSEITFDISATDIDRDQFQMTFEFIGGNPEVMPELENLGDGVSNFIWTPDFDDAGEYLIRFHLLSENERMPDVSLDVQATVMDVNRAPEVVNAIGDIQVNEDSGTTRVADLNEVFIDPDGDNLTFQVSGRGEIGAVIDENNILSITPAANFHGEGDVRVTADDGRNVALVAFHANGLAGSAQAARAQPRRGIRSVSIATSGNEGVNRDLEVAETFLVTVVSVNDMPRWENVPGQAIDINESALIEFDVSASDVDGDNLTLSFDRGNFPEEATFEQVRNGVGTFHWQTNFTNAGNYRGELVVTDGNLTARSVLFVTVHNVNRPPVWNNIPDRVDGRENTEINFDVAGSDPDNGALTITLIRNNLPQSASIQDHQNGTATFTWRPTFDEAGDYTATFRISDNVVSTDRDVAIHVAQTNRPPIVRAIPDVNIDEDADRTNLYTLSDFFSDPDGDGLRFRVEADGNVSAQINGGVLSVDPADNINGNFNIVVTADDNEFSVSDTFVLTVRAGNDDPFWVNPVREVTVREGDRIEFALRADDVDLAHEGDDINIFLRVEDGVVGNGANFDHQGANGTFIWVTDFEDAGVYHPEFRVEDRAGAFTDLRVTITINNFNRAPVIHEPTEQANFDVAVDERVELRVDFVADDADGDAIAWTLPDAGGMPNGFQFTDHRDGSATLLWTPPSDARRQPYTPLAVATDALGATDQVRLAITVRNVNILPVITEPANADIFRVEIEERQRLIVDFRSSDPDGGDLVWELTDPDGLPNGWQFTDNRNGTARFVWDVPFDARRQPYTPRFRTTDSDGGRDEIVVEITARDLNSRPVISQPSDQDAFQIRVDERAELRINFRASDPDNDALRWTVIDDGGLPQGWQFNDAGDGNATFIWTPSSDDGRQNPYSPVFQAADPGALSDRIRVDITVININRPPERQGAIDDVPVNEDEGRYEIGDLNQYFTDPDNDALQFSFAGAPQGLGMAIENGRVLFFRPDDNFNLAAGALITVTATDGALQATQQFRVTVVPVNDDPTAFDLQAPRDNHVLVDYRGTFSWTRASDVDNDAIRYSIVFTFVDAPVDTTFRRGPLQDTTFALSGVDTLIAQYRLEDSLRVRWWVEATDGQGTIESRQRWTVVVPPLSAPDEENFLPVEIHLSQNFPNPFNPETKLSFALPHSSDVTLTVYDMHARAIAIIAEGRFEAGNHEVAWNGVGNPAGIYLFVLQVGNERHVVKGAMLK